MMLKNAVGQNFEKFVLRDETRKRCKIVPASDENKKRFRPISLELFLYFKEIDKIDFAIYFRAQDEIIEFIRPPEYSKELLQQMFDAAQKPFVDVDIFILLKDYPKYEALLASIRSKKFKALLQNEPAIDKKTLEVFSDLSAASQMIVHGGINTLVAEKAKSAVAQMMQSQLSNDIVISTLSRMIECDSTLYDHSASVAMFSGVIAHQHLKEPLTDSEAKLVALGGLFHDVGKTCIPNSILNKPTDFTPEEWDIMKKHSELGSQEIEEAIAKGAPIEHVVAQVAFEHHERMRGTGYPLGKRGRLEEHPHGIHRHARIVMIADVYSAMLMKRVYKEAIPAGEAIQIMKSMSEHEYDLDLFNPFYESVVHSIADFEKKNEEIKKSRITLLGEKESFMKALKEREKASKENK